jgi:hypothetical protein
LGFTPSPFAHVVELQWHDVVELLWLLALERVFCASFVRIKAPLPSFFGSVELGLLRGFSLGEQVGHGRRVGCLLRFGAPEEFLLRSWIRCYLRHQSEAWHAFCFVAHFGAVLGTVLGMIPGVGVGARI